MTSQHQYYVKLVNGSGTMMGIHVYAYSSYAAMAMAADQYPKWRPQSAEKVK
jgi:hypothetical protein